MSPELIGAIVGGSIGLATGLATTALGYVFAWLQLKSNRAFELRQAIYVESAATIANGLEFFSRVAQLNVADDELARVVHPVSVAMYKIHVVGTPSTIAALSAANLELTVASLDLMKRRTLLRSAVAAASEAELQDANDRVQQLQRELFIEALKASLRYQRHLIEVNISARRELGLALDESQYREANREAEQRIANAIEEAVREQEQIAASSGRRAPRRDR